MAFFGGGSSSDASAANGGFSAEQKNTVMKQVQEEAAMSNARALMSVWHSHWIFRPPKYPEADDIGSQI
jgi:hypothetical protein